jgi:hypothetical protein
MLCEKSYTLVVEQGVLFVWGIAQEDADPPGIAVFTPDSASGNAAVGITTEPTGLIGELSQAFNSGLVTINTSAVIPCNMHIKSIYTGPALGLDFGSGWMILITNNATFTTLLQQIGDAQTGTNINTEYDVPFNLPNTSGVNNVIEFQLNVVCGEGTASGFATALTVQATLSVI